MRVPRERSFLLFGLDGKEYSWQGVRLLILVYFGAILFAAVLSPFVYLAIQFWSESFPNRLNSYLAEKDFPRYFDRLRWLPVILLLPWLLRRCGLLSFKNLGFGNTHGYSPALRWTAYGVLLILFAGAGQGLFLGVEYEASLTLAKGLQTLLIAILSALLIGVLEEAVFRGMILRMFYTALKPMPAVLLSSLFFAYVHFKKIPKEIWDDESTAVNLGSGFYVGFWTLLSIGQTFDFVRFLNLFLFGIVLCLLFLRTGSLWPCVGFHGGIVLARSIYDKCFNLPGETSNEFWGSGILLDGYFASILLGLLCLGLLKNWVQKSEHED